MAISFCFAWPVCIGRLLLWCLLVEEITAGFEGPEGNPGERQGQKLFRGNKRRRSAEEEFLWECPARSARVAGRDRPAMIGYQKAPAVSECLRECSGANLGTTPDRVPTESLSILSRPSRCSSEATWGQRPLNARDVRLATVISLDPGQKVCEGHEVVEVAVLKFLIHIRVDARRHQIRFIASVVRGTLPRHCPTRSSRQRPVLMCMR
jgi:hypothetical protein